MRLSCLICLLPVLAFGSTYKLRYYQTGEGNIMFPIVYTNDVDWCRQMLALGSWTLVTGKAPIMVCPDRAKPNADGTGYVYNYGAYPGINDTSQSVLYVDGEYLFLAGYATSAYSATNLPPFYQGCPYLNWCNWHLYGVTDNNHQFYCAPIDKTVDDSRIPRGYWSTMPATTHTETRNESGELTSWSETGTKPILSSDGTLIGVSSGVTGATTPGSGSSTTNATVDLSGVYSRLDLIHGAQHDYSSYLVNQAEANSKEVNFLPYLYDIKAAQKDYSSDLLAIKTAVDSKPVPSFDSASIVKSVNSGNALLARVADGVDSVKATLNASVGVNVGSDLPSDDPVDYSELSQANDQVQAWGLGLDDSWGWLNTGLDRFFGTVPNVGTATDGGSFDFGIAGFTFHLDFSRFSAFASWFRPCCLYALLVGWAFSAVAIVRGAFV